MREVQVEPLSLTRFESLLAAREAAEIGRAAASAREHLAGRTVWCVNSTSLGGGVAQMLRTTAGYARGAGLDVRWLVIDADERFFRVTKRLHIMLHGLPAVPTLDPGARALYDDVVCRNARALTRLVRPGDVVVLHDPQTAGLAPHLRAADVRVIWRSHIGADVLTPAALEAWAFLAPSLRHVDRVVVTKRAFTPPGLHHRTSVITPAIDALETKNLPMTDSAATAVLRMMGLTDDPAGEPTFFGYGRRRGTVREAARITQERPLRAGEEFVLHLARWDRLKDPVGTIAAFAAEVVPRRDAHLVLAGPAPRAVGDDPEGEEVLREVLDARDALAGRARERVHLVELGNDDVDVNGAMINALQRRAAVGVKKSVGEGFGLGITETMWKSRPVVATAVGGITEQVVDGVTGVLVDPGDPAAFGFEVAALLGDGERRTRLGRAAHRRVRDRFLEPRHLLAWARVVQDVCQGPQRAAADAAV